MRRNESWLAPLPNTSYSRGSHFRKSSSSIARFSRITPVLLTLVVALAAVVQVLRPLPLPQARATLASASVPGTKPVLPWPSQGGGELEVQNVGTMSSIKPNTELPLGSVAKIITALVVAKDHPLSLGNTGPTITVSSSDVTLYQTMLSQQDSVIPVALGEKLNEYQLLEALLIPSANNIAYMAANWDAGSVAAFVAKMNALAKSLGMHSMVFTGPSGLNPHTVGSAHDLIIAAQALLKNSVLSEIVAKPQADLPIVGVTYNIDYNVGHNGFVGIETGSMANGGNLVFAAAGPTGSKDLIVGAVLGQPGTQPLIAALSEGNSLVDAARKIPVTVRVLSAGQTVALISAPGISPVPVRATQSVSLIAWPGLRVTYSTKFSKLGHSVDKGTKVGTMRVSIGDQAQTVPLVATKAVRGPSWAWRLTRI